MSETIPYRPSNGSEGEIFYEHWCEQCQRERNPRGCLIYTLTLARSLGDPDYPTQWVSDADGGNPRCTAYTPKRPRRPPSHRIKDKRQRYWKLRQTRLQV